MGVDAYCRANAQVTQLVPSWSVWAVPGLAAAELALRRRVTPSCAGRRHGPRPLHNPQGAGFGWQDWAGCRLTVEPDE
jgi:hypothetical protein